MKSLSDMKPAAPARIHLLLAALLWTVVGALLALFGSRWVIHAALGWWALWLTLAAAVGVAKALLVLDRAGQKTIDRIEARGDGHCVGGFLSIQSWALIAVMAGTGYGLRHSHLSRTLVGLVYVAVGTALFFASRRLWSAWMRHGR